jgi:tRNA nucleotidyltransferase (CCA-adding enzyme)
MKKQPPQIEVITTHMNADFDALASMLAAKKLYPEAIMVFPGALVPRKKI